MSGRRVSSSEGTPDGTFGSARSYTDLPRGIGPGLRPSSTDSAFSVCAICDSINGICTAAVSYCDCTCETCICDTWPYLNCSWNRRTDSPYAPSVRLATASCSSRPRSVR